LPRTDRHPGQGLRPVAWQGGPGASPAGHHRHHRRGLPSAGPSGRQSRSHYEALKKAVNESPSVAADETGWRIGGWPGWLWTFAIEAATVYLVDHERSFEAATKVLEPDYDGVNRA